MTAGNGARGATKSATGDGNRAEAIRLGSACRLREGALVVTGPLDRSEWASFEEACTQLVEGQAWKQVEIDLTNCRYLSSLFIGLLVGACLKIEKQGRTVRVRVSPEVARFLDMAHLNEVVKYEVSGRA